VAWCLSGEEVGGVFEQLLRPADDNGIGALMFGAEGGKRLVAFEGGAGNLCFEFGRELTRLRPADGS
jgi:hypothetical protein